MSGARTWFWGAILALSLWVSPPLAETQITDPSEVDALHAIRNKLTDPLKHLENWNSGDPCLSNWTGVICYNSTLDDYLHIEELQLLKMELMGTLAPDLGRLSHLKILDFMWNKVSGSIPKEIGNIKSLVLLLLNGNQLSGSIPDELGFLPNLDRIQLDENYISGTLPISFANLEKLRHMHMNNNSISGKIPVEISKLPNLFHILLDNNNLSGRLPSELSQLPNLHILQLDNNKFESEIPLSYRNMSKLLKLSLRNCSLHGGVPDLSSIPHLSYLDLSWNRLTGSIPPNKLSDNITSILLSYNDLNGSIPLNFSSLPSLQTLSLQNNSLSGSVPSSLWQKNVTLSNENRILLSFQNNFLSNISGVLDPPANATIMLQGNPICSNQHNIDRFCEPQNGSGAEPGSSTNPSNGCNAHCPTDEFYELAPASYPLNRICLAPLRVGYRLKSPGISYFLPYKLSFESFLTSHLGLHIYQLAIDSYEWETGPRLRMYLKLFPAYDGILRSKFNDSEVHRIEDIFADWKIPNSDVFGPAELLNFTLLGPYENVINQSSKSRMRNVVVVGIVLGAVAGTIAICAIILIIIMRRQARYFHEVSRRRLGSKFSIKIDGVKEFTFEEMTSATNGFNQSTEVGQGGYGKVYKGILADGTIVAIKRAQEGSLQGKKEFLTEIELLSRLHHRNLVSLLGYCAEDEEQMLIYEFMPNHTLRDHLSAKAKLPLSFAMRLRIALCSAKGILYLHTEADPPIFHRDIKATNILLDLNFNAKVADFGLSRLAPLPDIDGATPSYVSTIVKGTPGYLDPEYVLTQKLTDKSDVYSLGVVFLELLTGMQPISHGKNIVREANAAYQSGMMFSVIDSRMGSYPSECLEQFISLALRCCNEETEGRPSMAEVVRELEGILRRMPESDGTPSEQTTTDVRSGPFPSESSRTVESYASSLNSGSDLRSTGLPVIRPR